MDKKGLAVFLAVTFALGIGAQIATLSQGWLLLGEGWTFLDTLVFCLVLAIPGLGAVAARLVSGGFQNPPTRVWPLHPAPTLRIVASVIAVFALSYTVATLLGMTQPDWRLGELIVQIQTQTNKPIPAEIMGILPPLLLFLGLTISTIIGATVFAAVALLAEYGWRGYLYPQLSGLGRIPAALVTGVLWWAFFLPLMYTSFSLMDNPDKMTLLASFAARSLAIAIAVSFVLGRIMRRTGHLGLVAVAVGSIVAHQSIIWEQLFPTTTLPWTGPFGLIMAALWLALAFIPGVLTNEATSPKSDQITANAQNAKGSA